MTFTILKFVFCSSSGTISIFIWLLSISILYFIMAHFFALTFISNIITNYCVYSLIDYKRFLYVRESAGSLTVYFPQWKKKASAKGPPKRGSGWQHLGYESSSRHLSLCLHLPSAIAMHWLCPSFVWGGQLFARRLTRDSLCNCLWFVLKDHT